MWYAYEIASFHQFKSIYATNASQRRESKKKADLCKPALLNVTKLWE